MSKTIRLGGKYAVGVHEFAIVDDEDFERLSQWKWQARRNGNGTHVYAARTAKDAEGRNLMFRMHRVVLDYSGPLDVDHINRNTLDNRRENLRAVTRSVNARNTEQITHQFKCLFCGAHQSRVGSPNTRRRLFCSDSCLTKHHQPEREPKPRQRYTCACTWCGINFEAGKADSKFCGERCKKAEKWARQRASGTLPPSANGYLGSPVGLGSRVIATPRIR